MWQAILVGALVSWSAAYAVWVLMPVAARLRLARRILRIAEGRPALGWLRRAAGRVESAEQARLAGCSNCGSAATVRRGQQKR
jgi:hypothetical protein